MDVTKTEIPGVVLITPARFGDDRGFFSEIYNRRALADIGIHADFKQENYSYSADRGTLRGLHFQLPPATQTKLLRVVKGAVLDVCVDCRIGSPTYGKHVKAEITAESRQQILCPQGFAHGMLTLMPHTEIAYRVDAYYAPDLDSGVSFDDPDLAIDWPLPMKDIILSEKDRKQPAFRDLPAVFSYPGTILTQESA